MKQFLIGITATCSIAALMFSISTAERLRGFVEEGQRNWAEWHVDIENWRRDRIFREARPEPVELRTAEPVAVVEPPPQTITSDEQAYLDGKPLPHPPLPGQPFPIKGYGWEEYFFQHPSTNPAVLDKLEREFGDILWK